MRVRHGGFDDDGDGDDNDNVSTEKRTEKPTFGLVPAATNINDKNFGDETFILKNIHMLNKIEMVLRSKGVCKDACDSIVGM